MIKKDVTVIDKIGFHARTASLFAKEAAGFSCNVKIEFNNKSGKSTLSIMTLGVKSNDNITVITEGIDEEAAMTSLVKMIENNFNN